MKTYFITLIIVSFSIWLLEVSNCYCQSNWQQTYGPCGGQITTLTSDNNNHLFVGTNSYGIFHSTDNGESWFSSNNGLEDLNIKVIKAFTSSNGEDYLFAGTTFGGIFRSTNSGTTWTARNVGLNNKMVFAIEAYQDELGRINLIAGTYSGIYLSTDAGDNWKEISNGLNFKTIKALAVYHETKTNGRTIFYAGGAGIYRSTDKGENWTPINNGIHGNDISSIIIIYNSPKTDSLTIFAGSFFSGVYKTTTSGDKWGFVNQGLSKYYVNSLISRCYTDSSFTLFVGTQGGVAFSNVYGDYWDYCDSTLSNTEINTLCVNESSAYSFDILAGTNTKGVIKASHPDYKFKTANKGIYATGPGKLLTINNYDKIFMSCRLGGIFSSDDYGLNWNTSNEGLEYTQVGGLANIGNSLFCTSVSKIYHSTNYAQNWTELSSDLPLNNLLNIISVPSSVNNEDTLLFVLTLSQGLYRSSNNGINWAKAGDGLPGTIYLSDIKKINNRIFLSTTGQGLFISEDNGNSWVTSDSGITSKNLSDVVQIEYRGKSIIIVGSSSCIFKSIDNGMSWTKIKKGLPLNEFVYSIAIKDSIIFVGTGDGKDGGKGIYISLDGGESFTVFDTGLTDYYVSSLAIIKEQNEYYLYAATENSGVWKRAIPSVFPTDVKQISREHIDNFYLYQNYPNPFNPSTTINYQLPFSGKVSIKIFNSLGQNIETFVNEYQEAGFHSVLYTPKVSLSSGIYFYQLQISILSGKTSEFILTRKLMLVK